VASNISVSVTADARPLQAGLDAAKQAVRDFSREARRVGSDLGSATSAAQQATAAFGTMREGAADVARQLLITGTSATQGAFAQIPEVTGAAQTAVTGLSSAASALPGAFQLVGAAAAAAAAGIAFLTLRANEAKVALQGVFAAAMLQGRNADLARLRVEAAAQAMTKFGNLSTTEGLKIAASIDRLPTITEATREALLRLAPALHEAFRGSTEGDAAKTADEIVKVFQSTQALTRFVRENALVGANEIARFNEALADPTGAKMQELAVVALNRRWGQSTANLEELRTAYRKWVDEFLTNGKVDQVGQLPDLSFDAFQRQRGMLGGSLTQLRPPEAPVSQELRDYLTVAGEIKTAEGELAALRERRTVIEAALGQAVGETNRAVLQAQLREIDQQIQLNRAKGDASWEQEQRAAMERSKAAILDRATDHKKAQLDMLRTEAAFWTGVAQQANLTQGQISTAQTNAMNARRQLRMAELAEAAAAARTGARDADRAERERSQALLAEAQTRGRLTTEAIAQRKAELDEEVAAERMTKAQALQILQQFVEAQKRLQLEALDAALAQLQEGTQAYQRVADQKLVIEQQTQRQLQQLRAEASRAAMQEAQRTAQIYAQAFSGVESTIKRTFTDLLMGTTTWNQAALAATRSVVQGVTELGFQMLSRWAALELAKSSISSAATAARVATEQAAGQSGWAALLMSWLGIETAKTATTAAAATTRMAAEQSAEKAGMVLGAAQRVAEVEGLAGVAGAAAFASTAAIPIVGPAMAPGAAAAAIAAVQAMVPLAAAAQGVWNLPGDMPMQLHKGEMVIPQRFAQGLRQNQGSAADGVFGGGGGAAGPGRPVNISIHAIDTQTGAEFLMRNIDRIARGVAGAFRNNPSLRPAY